MKHLHLYENFIGEGKQAGNLYHFTNINSIVNIAKENLMRGSYGNQDVRGKYISVSRNKNLYKQDPNLGVEKIEVIIVFDGEKLSNNFKIVPYLYEPYRDLDKESSESEELIMLPKGELQNINKYIKEIIFLKSNFKAEKYLRSLGYNLGNLYENFDDTKPNPGAIEKARLGIFYHGSTDKNLAGKKGIHIGTKLAATEALEARIGVPAKGEWDGTREYGKTLLAGTKTLAEPRNKWKSTGFNCCGDIPVEDYYSSDRKRKAKYSDDSEIPIDCKPIVFPVKIIGRMSNDPYHPHNDTRANSLIIRGINKGNARSGFYYVNDGEDTGSISAVVPDKSFLQVI